MSDATIFPEAVDDGCEPFRQIGSRLGCDEYLIHDAFRGLGVPEWEVPTHLDAVKATTHALNESARHAENLLRAMRKLSVRERGQLIEDGAPTFSQIEFLHDILAGDAANLKGWLAKRHRAGGRNPAAYIVAEGMRRVFRRLRKNVTFGFQHDGGPSTEFGREVTFALGAFGLQADWRRPTEEAANKQGKIKARLIEYQIKKQQSENLLNPPKRPDMKGIEIQTETVNGTLFYVFSLIDNPEIPAFRMNIKNDPNGRDITKYAHQWATSGRAAKA